MHIYAYAKHITAHQLQLAYACIDACIWPKKPRKEFCWLEDCWGYPSMKQEQLEVATTFLEGKDVFAVLPTG